MTRMQELPYPYRPSLSPSHLEYLAAAAEAAHSDPFIASL